MLSWVVLLDNYSVLGINVCMNRVCITGLDECRKLWFERRSQILLHDLCPVPKG
jgi:hypothetical protein